MKQEQSVHQLLSDIAEHEVPNGSLDLTERIRQQARAISQQRPARRVPLLRIGLATLAVLALLTFSLRLAPEQTVSAHEALRRAEQANSFGISGVQSLHGVLESFAPGSGSLVREEVWMVSPSQLRKEIIWPAGQNITEAKQTNLLTPEGAWMWSVPASTPDALPDSILQLDPAELDGSLYVIPNPYTSLDTPTSSSGLCAQPGDQLTLLGEEAMLGRDVLVIECQIAADDAIGQPGARLKFWIDKQFYLVLQSEYYEESGEIFVESRFTSLEIDQEIPAERFELIRPEGVPIIDTRTN